MLKRLGLIIVFLAFAVGVFAENFPFIAEVTKEGVNIRSGANINFESLYQTKKGERLIIKSKSYDWYKVVLPKGVTCFISIKYVKMQGDNSGILTADRVNIRAKPGENFTIIGQARQGDILNITGRSDGWYSISPLDNCYGWIHEKFVKFSAPFSEEAAKNLLKTETPPVNTQNKEIARAETASETSEPKNEGELFEAMGIVEARGNIINRQGSHKLTINGKPAYYLKGQPKVFDEFLNLWVKVLGEKKTIPTSDLPIIEVKRIIASP